MDNPILFSPEVHSHLIPSFVQIHKSCILSPPHVVATFLPPLQEEVMASWWQDRCKEVEAGTRYIIMQMANNSENGREELAGYVMLYNESAATIPFRGAVEKLLVHPDHRKKGIARALMTKLDEVAKSTGLSLLFLDTTVGSGAEYVYPKLGYIELGYVPKYLVSPVDGSLLDGMFFYKDVREL